MILINDWMEDLTSSLKFRFGDRLLLVGLQGSYQRGEATESSDIDAVIILETLSLDDLKAIKSIFTAMPESEKICGFVGGRKELWNWPNHELFQFTNDTRVYYGSFAGLLPEVGRGDVIDSVRVGASCLYHTCCHTYLHGDSGALKEFYKSAFFVLQAADYLRRGEYARSKKELLAFLAGNERRILTINMNVGEYEREFAANPDEYFGLLINWCAEILDEKFAEIGVCK